jgi:hypothetical protein
MTAMTTNAKYPPICVAGADLAKPSDGMQKWSFCTFGGAARADASPGR